MYIYMCVCVDLYHCTWKSFTSESLAILFIPYRSSSQWGSNFILVMIVTMPSTRCSYYFFVNIIFYLL